LAEAFVLSGLKIETLGTQIHESAFEMSHPPEKGDSGSMDDPLRPISTLELLDKTLSLYCRNFVKFAGLSIVGPVATFAYRLLSNRSPGRSSCDEIL
jgi:hypothetical protein